jgi:TPR repeat protein
MPPSFLIHLMCAERIPAYAAYKLGSYYYAGVQQICKKDLKRALKWLNKAKEANKTLSDWERGNIDKYLKSIDANENSSQIGAPPSASNRHPLETVPEHIGVNNNLSREVVQRGGHETDHDSVSASTIGMRSATGTSSTTASSLSSPLSSQYRYSNERGSSHNSSTRGHSNTTPTSQRSTYSG